MRVMLDSRRKRLREIEKELARLRSLPVETVYKHILVRELDGTPPQEDSGDDHEVGRDREVLIRTITAR